MTAREYAKMVGIEIVGKLTKKSTSYEKYDAKKGDFVEKKITFWIDEIGNELEKTKDGWVAYTADGGCI